MANFVVLWFDTYKVTCADSCQYGNIAFIESSTTIVIDNESNNIDECKK